MDLIKLGQSLQILRKEKGLTQEQVAERFNVSRRTVSRWETGSNMPDIDILIDMSDFYEVDIRKLLEGERSRGKTGNDIKETILKISEYGNAQRIRYANISRLILIIAFILMISGILIRGLASLGVLTVNPNIGIWLTLSACIFAIIGDFITQIENRRVVDALKRISEKLSDL